MKVVYHKRFNEVYSHEPAAEPGRMESIYNELHQRFEFVIPNPASEEDLRLVHSESHIESVKCNSQIYELALLAVGGAIKASNIAVEGEPAFGLIRPPGHHAGRGSSWGFCYFNNIAISVERLRREGRIRKAVIVDIDLHYGDGTANIFSSIPEVFYFHINGRWREDFLRLLRQRLNTIEFCDIITVSAGFDTHEEDWGRILATEDYKTIGAIIKDYAERITGGRRYALLEGGYNISVLGRNIKSFLEGFT